MTWEGNAGLREHLARVDTLHPHPRNPRRGDVAAIRDSLARFGQQRPILALPDGTIVAGNHTYRAAIDAGWTHIAVTRSDLEAREVDAYLAADNRLSDLGTYDDSLLGALLDELRSADGLRGTGYADGDVEQLLAALRLRERMGDPDVAPPVPSAPRSKTGEVYQLGRHRLVCGDAEDATAYEIVLEGEHADMVWTDPPYGVNAVGGHRGIAAHKRRKQGHLVITNDTMSGDDLEQFLRRTLGMTYAHTRPGSNWYVAAPSAHLVEFLAAATPFWKWLLLWVKDSAVLSRMDYHLRHEHIIYGWKPGGKRVRPTDRTLTSVMEIPRPKSSDLHPTMKPVELIEIGVKHSSRGGDRVLDPFGGSGSTMIACERLGRRAALIEIDPAYCDVIRQRYADYTGNPEYAP